MFESGTRRPSRAMADRLAACLQVPDDEQDAFIQLARAPGNGATVQEDSRAPAVAPSESVPEQAPPQPIPVAPPGDRPTILATKLYRPRPRADLTPRPRLRASGCGINRRTDAHRRACQLGQDDGASRLAQPRGITTTAPRGSRSKLVTPAQSSFCATSSPACKATAHLLRSPQAPPIDILLPRLLNDLVELPDSTILILDDYHVVDSPEAHQILTFLLDHLQRASPERLC